MGWGRAVGFGVGEVPQPRGQVPLILVPFTPHPPSTSFLRLASQPPKAVESPCPPQSPGPVKTAGMTGIQGCCVCSAEPSPLHVGSSAPFLQEASVIL